MSHVDRTDPALGRLLVTDPRRRPERGCAMAWSLAVVRNQDEDDDGENLEEVVSRGRSAASGGAGCLRIPDEYQSARSFYTREALTVRLFSRVIRSRRAQDRLLEIARGDRWLSHHRFGHYTPAAGGHRRFAAERSNFEAHDPSGCSESRAQGRLERPLRGRLPR